MKKELIKIICCPYCKEMMSFVIGEEENGEIKEGLLNCSCGRNYPVRNYIPRFVDGDKYVNSFSFEWHKHKKTQLDSANKNSLSETAFRSCIDFSPQDLKTRLVLDAGCGMGRYTEVARKYGATVIGVDLRYAVDAAFENMGFEKNVHFIQADLFCPPFKEDTFDFVYSFGVLHHTPDAARAFREIAKLTKQKGKLSMFVYDTYEKAIVYSSNFWRKITTRLPKRLLYWFCHVSIPLYYLYKLPVIGHLGKAFFVISMQANWRWRLLDAFDWYSAKYQSKHTHWEVFKWFESAGFENIKIFENGVTMMGTKR